jgi:hypothetical protein
VTRTLAFALVAVALVLLLILLASLSAPRVRSSAPHAWRPAPTALFTRWPSAIIGSEYSVVPSDTDVPVDAGLGAYPPKRPTVQSRLPSILPSVRPHPTGGLIPPYVAEKGVAGIATWYVYHRGQAAAAARLRDVLGPSWRSMVVRVDGPLGHLYVRLTDWESSGIPGRLIDLDSRDFAAICGPLSTGVCDVTVTRS